MHSELVWRSGAWIRLWYYLRGLDSRGRGRVDVPIFVVEYFLKTKQSTIYEWLRVGRSRGGFRRYAIRRGLVRVYLGGLHPFCESLGVEDWGAVSVVSIDSVYSLGGLKHEAAKATAVRGQFASIYKQRLSLSEPERKFYKPVLPEDLFRECDKHPSLKPDAGAVPKCVLWVGPKKIFVSAGFLPFGKNQISMARDLGISVDTVQRHLKGLDRRQLCQSKSAYRTVGELMEHHGGESERREIRPRTYFQIDRDGIGHLEEPVGQSSGSMNSTIKPGRVFAYGDRYWLYRCNVYRPTVNLTSMSRSRHNHSWRLKVREEVNQSVLLMIEFLRAAGEGLGTAIRNFYIKGGLLRAFKNFEIF